MTPSLALLPSPLLGPSVWEPVAKVLNDLGWHVLTCRQATTPRTAQDVLQALLGALPVQHEMVLVPHSNAGAYVPELTTRRHVVATVFVDAVLPPASGRMPLAPPALLDRLREMADRDGMLPAWTDWWDEADVAVLFPDAQSRTGVEREQHRLPLSYFQEQLAIPPGWDTVPGAYLSFGDTYAAEREQAAQRDWQVRTLRGGHLHMLNDPPSVAAELISLLGALGTTMAG
jgi:hypothetical protein